MTNLESILKARSNKTCVYRNGVWFDIKDFNADSLSIHMVANGLSCIRRFSGTDYEGTVLQHSIRIANKMPTKELRLAALMHDATEAIIGDVIAPLKAAVPEISKLEDSIAATLMTRFGADYGLLKHPILKKADSDDAETELRIIFGWDDPSAELIEEYKPICQIALITNFIELFKTNGGVF